MQEIQIELKRLNPNKSNPSNSISTKLLQQKTDICSESLLSIINYGITNSIFDDAMKLADLIPVNKKKPTTEESLYRPISGLHAGSKVYGKDTAQTNWHSH